MIEHYVSKEEELHDILIKYIEEKINFVNILINRCKISKEELVCIRDRPDFLIVFSGDEILEINLKERNIRELIHFINKIRESICIENIKSVTNGSIKNKTEEAEIIVDMLSKFVESKCSKLPKIKVDVFSWIILPYDTTMYFFRKIVHLIKMKRILRNKKKSLKQIK